MTWWPLAPLPFAILGAILIARLWYVVPGRKPADPSAEALVQRAQHARALLHKVQRVTLGIYAAIAGAASVLTVILPQHVARELMGHGMLPGAIVQAQLHAGARIGLALVALAAAFTPRPPKSARARADGGAHRFVGRADLLGADGRRAVDRAGGDQDGLVARTALAVTVLLGTTVARANVAPLPKERVTL